MAMNKTAATAAVPVRGVSIRNFIDDAFKGLDLNKDGVIGRAEVFETLGPLGKEPLLAFVVNQIIGRFDGNKDGSIAQSEAVSVLGRLDSDQDGLLSLPEIRVASIELVGLLAPLVPPAA